MNSYDLDGQIAVVTGGAQGIGAAIAERLARSGAIVEVWDLDTAGPDARLAAIPDQQLGLVPVDVTDTQAVAEAAHALAARHGRIDIMVTSAGIAGPTSTLWDYPVDAWRKVQEVNVNGVFNCLRAVVPAMIESGYGRIVNIASVAGKEGNPNASAYSASKAAVIGLTKSLGKELATQDIAVNCITPAAAKTRILDQVSREFIDYMLSKIPRQRLVTVEEIANMACWLASRECSFTTAAVFDASGGRATY